MNLRLQHAHAGRTSGFGQERSFNGHGLKKQMKNPILEKTDQVRWCTNMREVSEATNIAPQADDWYVSDIAKTIRGIGATRTPSRSRKAHSSKLHAGTVVEL